jgi:ribosomal RNA-processing protein 12
LWGVSLSKELKNKKARICDEPEKAKALVGALWGWDEEALSAHRRDMKVLVERLMKRAGPNAVSEGMPTLEGKRLVSALAKKKRRKKNEYEKKHKEKDVLDDKKTKNKKKGEEEDKKKKQKKKSERFLDPDVADLMSTTTSVSSAKPKAKRDFESEFELDAQTGKPLVLDPEDEDMLRVQREESKARAKGGDCEDYEPEEEEEDRDAEEEKKRGPGKQKKSKNTMKSATEVMGGKMYKAKKAKGDLKKGKFDPFSYVKLDPKNLNRRRAGHTADQFSEMFQKKRPGVKRGHKHTKSKYAK